MASITVRGLDEHVLERIRTLAQVERRSLNSELLVLIERAVNAQTDTANRRGAVVPKETQLRIWRRIAGWWDDEQATEEIIADIYGKRTLGRDIAL